MTFQHTFDEEVQEGVKLQGKDVWRPTVGLPYFTTKGLPFWKRLNESNWRPECGCGRISPDLQAHNEHYIYMAVWQNESGYIPSLLAAPAE